MFEISRMWGVVGALLFLISLFSFLAAAGLYGAHGSENPTTGNSQIVVEREASPEADRAFEALSSCLENEPNSSLCLGSSLQSCTSSRPACVGAEVDAWARRMNEALTQLNINNHALRDAQSAWEKYLENECLFTSHFWDENPIMRRSETDLCYLRLYSERSIRLENYVKNLSQ